MAHLPKSPEILMFLYFL